jgi:uncharacterized membrane protein YeiB
MLRGTTVADPLEIRTPEPIGPVSGLDRIVSIGVLRGTAGLGILLINIVPMGLPFAAYNDPIDRR